MPGLNLGVMGGVKATAGNGYTSVAAPATASEAGFGPGYTAAGGPSTMTALTPNDPFGIAFWLGVGAVAALLVIRHSLPA
jgi:hypothetical protein